MLIRDIRPPDKKRKPGNSVILAPKKETNRVRELLYMFAAALAILFALNLVNLINNGLKFKQSLTLTASAGFEKIVNGAINLKNTNFEYATGLFNEAKSIFENIENEAWFVSPSFSGMHMSDPVFDAAGSVISAGKYLSQAGESFTRVAKELQTLPKDFFAANAQDLIVRPSLTEKLKSQLPNILQAAQNLDMANASIQKVPTTFIPPTLRERFDFSKTALESLSDFTKSLNTDIPAILTLLGDARPHTYLILLQNNAELRPTGGFIGNYMIIETNDGYITKSKVYDVYGADHELVDVLSPPPEISPVNKRWFLRDSNYSGHFPLSAEKAAWFLEHENGPGVDTVIAIDQSFIRELMRATGDINIPELPRALTADNFSTVLSYIVEAKISGRQNPKAILQSFVPAFEQAMFKKVDPASLIPAISAAIEQKHLLGYSRDADVQDFFRRRKMSGEMKTLLPKEDYLNIVHTSIGGNKSDAYVSEKIAHDTYLQSDGSVIDEVAITRSHKWNSATERALKTLVSSFGFEEFSKNLMEILGRSRNLQALRIYVPAGSTIEENSDPAVIVKLDEETGKTYFSAKMEVGTGDEKTLAIRYKLPFKLDLDPVDKYVLTVQKQAGQDNAVIKKSIIPAGRVMNYKYFPETGAFDPDGVWSFETELDKDISFTSIWGK